MALQDQKYMLSGIYDVSIDGNDVGITADGITVTYTQQFYEHVGDQLLDTVKMTPIKFAVKIAFGLKEISLGTLKTALNQANSAVPSSGHETLTVGYNREAVEREITFTSPAPEDTYGGKKRTFTFTRCVIDNEIAFSMKKTDGTILPLTARVLPILNVDEEDCYFTIDDEV